NDKFIIERSTDGKAFTAIGEVKGKDFSNQIAAYSFKDEQPINGYNYYRLKQMDVDGKITYSEIEDVDFSISHTDILVYPNPFISSLNFSGIKARQAQVAL